MTTDVLRDFRLDQFLNFYLNASGDGDSIFPYPSAEAQQNVPYVQEQEVNFYSSIVLKQEFGTLRPKRVEKKPTHKGTFLPHQQFMGRFLSFYTPYNRMLAVHGIGTGKSAVILSVAQTAKRVNENAKVFIVVSSDTLYRTLINDIAFNLTDAFKPVITLDMYRQKKEEALSQNKSFNLTYEEWVATLTKNKVKNAFKIVTLNKFVKEFVKPVYNKPEACRNLYKDSVFIFDEAHNLKPTPEFKASYEQLKWLCHTVTYSKILLLTGTPMIDDAVEVINLLNLLLPSNKQLPRNFFAKHFFNSRLTTTEKDQNKGTFKDKYLRGIISYVKASITADITHAGQIASTLVPQAPALQQQLVHTKVLPLSMSPFQSQKYIEAFWNEGGYNPEIVPVVEEAQQTSTQAKKKGAKRKTIQPPTLDSDEETEDDNVVVTKAAVAKKGSKKRSESGSRKKRKTQASQTDQTTNEKDDEDEQGSELYLQSRKASISVFEPSDKNAETSIKTAVNRQHNVEDKLTALEKYSVKMAWIVRQLLQHQPGTLDPQKMFVFSNLVTVGANVLAFVLRLFGYQELTLQNKNTVSPKYLLLTGSKMGTQAKKSDIEITELTNVFNQSINKYGDYCQVVIGSKKIGEGVTFKHCRSAVLLTPNWNESTTQQALGRAIRSFAHDDLPAEKRSITVYRLAAIPQQSEVDAFLQTQPKTPKVIVPVDFIMYGKSEVKDKQIKVIERMLKEAAVDCAINRDRNILPSALNNTSECDYSTCDYECDKVDKRLYYEGAYTGPYIQDTYNLYYAEEEFVSLVSAIKSMFTLQSTFDFYHMIDVLKRSYYVDKPISSIVLARVLTSLINMNEPVMNRHGFINYLRNEKNMYFLVDSPIASNSFDMYTYADQPYPVYADSSNFDLQLQNLSNNRYESILQLLTSGTKETLTKDNVDKLFELLGKPISLKLQDVCFEEQNKGNISTLSQLISDYYGAAKQQRELSQDELVELFKAIHLNPFKIYTLTHENKLYFKQVLYPLLTYPPGPNKVVKINISKLSIKGGNIDQFNIKQILHLILANLTLLKYSLYTFKNYSLATDPIVYPFDTFVIEEDRPKEFHAMLSSTPSLFINKCLKSDMVVLDKQQVSTTEQLPEIYEQSNMINLREWFKEVSTYTWLHSQVSSVTDIQDIIKEVQDHIDRLPHLTIKLQTQNKKELDIQPSLQWNIYKVLCQQPYFRDYVFKTYVMGPDTKVGTKEASDQDKDKLATKLGFLYMLGINITSPTYQGIIDQLHLIFPNIDTFECNDNKLKSRPEWSKQNKNLAVITYLLRVKSSTNKSMVDLTDIRTQVKEWMSKFTVKQIEPHAIVPLYWDITDASFETVNQYFKDLEVPLPADKVKSKPKGRS